MTDTLGAGVSGFKKSPFRLPATNHAGLGMRGAARRFCVIFHRAFVLTVEALPSAFFHVWRTFSSPIL